VRKLLGIALVSAAALSAQTTSSSSAASSTSVDINGHRVSEGPQIVTTKSPTGTVITEILQSVNGRLVPIERTEERVVRDDASGKVVERVVRRFDQTGIPSSALRQTIEEQKRPDGSSTTTSTTYRGDVNGKMQLIEKATTEARTSATEERSETVIQRPSVNGTLDTAEKQSRVAVKQGTGYREEETTYRTSGNGGLYAAVRTVTDHAQQGSESSDNTVEYEANPSGSLQLHSQKVVKTVTAPDGSKESVVDLYSTHVPGRVDATGAGLKLEERQLVQRQKTGPDTVTETLSVQRPTVTDPNTLGPSRQLSQTVCKGACKP